MSVDSASYPFYIFDFKESRWLNLSASINLAS